MVGIGDIGMICNLKRGVQGRPLETVRVNKTR